MFGSSTCSIISLKLSSAWISRSYRSSGAVNLTSMYLTRYSITVLMKSPKTLNASCWTSFFDEDLLMDFLSIPIELETAYISDTNRELSCSKDYSMCVPNSLSIWMGKNVSPSIRKWETCTINTCSLVVFVWK